MEISIVIVNYKVPHHLWLALKSIEESAEYFESKYFNFFLNEKSNPLQSKFTSVEVWVVDNGSDQESLKFVIENFSWVKWIFNKENLGFSAANNQALKICSGKYLLIQNPDTVLPKHTLWNCWSKMEASSNFGAMGVRMVDSFGRFLKESKRGVPSPWASFCKIFGLTSIFPGSRILSSYYQGHLDENKDHKIPILAGAFMWVKNEVAHKVGFLDEAYFMYGEDIDWSYRINKAGFDNYYYSGITILHFKGESTQKGSLNYVKLFYGAMLLFVNKHYTGKSQAVLKFVLKVGILLRAIASACNRISKKFVFLISDLVGFYFILLGIVRVWEKFLKPGLSYPYPDEFLVFVLPLFILIWIVSIFLMGGYLIPIKLKRMINAFFLGTAFVLILHGLFPEDLRFSRGIILLGAPICFGFSYAFKKLSVFILNQSKTVELDFGSSVIGLVSHRNHVQLRECVNKLNGVRWIGYFSNLSDCKMPLPDSDYLGSADSISAVLRTFLPTHIIIDSDDELESLSELMNEIANFRHTISLCFWTSKTSTLIGNGLVITSREDKMESGAVINLKIIDFHLKRIMDIFWGFLILFTQIVWFCLLRKNTLMSISLDLLQGRKSWMGTRRFKLMCSGNSLQDSLFDIEKHHPNIKNISENARGQAIMEYYNNFNWLTEIKVCISCYMSLIRNQEEKEINTYL